jgi:uncharacterized protein with von Willebrand factor type A (vWA) domain
MADARAMVRVIDELLWRMRREGLAVPPSSAIDALAAVRAVGLEDRDVFRAALACVLVKDARERRPFDRAFDAFFSGARRGTLAERLAAAGFSREEIAVLEETLRDLAGAEDLGLFLAGGSDLDRVLALAGMTRVLSNLAGPLQRGFYAHRALDRAGATSARKALGALRTALRDALGERGDALADALAREVEASEDVVRDRVAARAEREELPRRGPIAERAIASLDHRELGEVRRAVRTFSARLRGAARVRKRRARRGRIDPHKTVRRALHTFGVPISPAHLRRRRDKPRIVLLCDVSDSVRDVAGLLLEFVYSAHDLFESTRSFVFVGDVGEATALFRRETAVRAIAAAHGGAVVPVTGNSNYGRALRTFTDRFRDAVDRRTTLVVLGDGRTNYQDDGAAALEQLRTRAKRVLWICPDPRERWSEGDSAMNRYAGIVSVLEVRTARDLELAARKLTTR